MIRTLKYPIIRNKMIIGHYFTTFKLIGTHLVVPEISMLKQPYSQKPKFIKIPIKWRITKDDGVEVHYQRYLDFSKKTGRQIEILNKTMCILKEVREGKE